MKNITKIYRIKIEKKPISLFDVFIIGAFCLVCGILVAATILDEESFQPTPLKIPVPIDVQATEERAESALDEIKTLYQGMTVLASWYGIPYHGRRAADGEVYDMTRDTVAHRYLELGTIVVLENVKNGRMAIAKVTDRGPYIEGRALDVSRAIADTLGMTREGLAPVRIWVLPIPARGTMIGRASEGD